jgi:hypothetical protein
VHGGGSHLQVGKLCDVTKAPYSARNGTNATVALQTAIDDCGDLPDGGTVLVPSGFVLITASLWLRSNLTFRVEMGFVAVVATPTPTPTDPVTPPFSLVFTHSAPAVLAVTFVFFPKRSA